VVPERKLQIHAISLYSFNNEREQILAGCQVSVTYIFIVRERNNKIMGFFKFRTNQDAPEDKSILLNNRSQIFSDAYRTLCANIEHLIDEQHLSSILITSAIGGEGKTTSAINLGITFAKEGKNVLLVNVDSHNNRFNQRLKIDVDVPGISDYAGTNKDLPIIHLDENQMDVLPYGHGKEVSARKIAASIEQLKDKYDLIILLSSVVNAYAETALLAKEIDGTLLVVKQGGSTADEISTAIHELHLAGANLIGTIFSHYDTLQDRKTSKKYKRLYQ